MSDLDAYISVSPGETRLAWADADGVLRRYEVERGSSVSLVGSLFRARVSRVEKSMGGAFLDLGAAGEALLTRGKDGKSRPVTEGQWLLVQITRDAHGSKGPAATSRITMTGRLLAFSPFETELSYDRRLGKGRARAEAEAAVNAVSAIAGDSFAEGGWLIRPAASAATPEMLMAEQARLRENWAAIQDTNDGAKPIQLLPPPGLLDRVLLEAPAAGRVAIDDRTCFAELKKRCTKSAPDLLESLLYRDPGMEGDLFESTGLAEQIDDALARQVSVPGGGRLTFDKTEALTVIDVDMADATASGKSDAATRLNVRAVEEAARQIQLRNISGQILLDCVRMKNRGDAKKVLEALRRGFKGSAVSVDILGFTPGGLIEIIRQRTGRTLLEMLGNAASTPMLEQSVESPETIALQALRDLLALRGAGIPSLTAAPSVIALLKGSLSEALAETERRLGQAVTLAEDPGAESVARQPLATMEKRS